MSYSLNQLYHIAGISKQGACQYEKRQVVFDAKVVKLVREAELLREEHPGCGVEKMYYTLKPDFIGRDRFIELFMQLGFRIKRKKNYRRTTYSLPTYYPNLIDGMLLHSPNQIWQSDITYIKVVDRFYYVVFIIDVYTKKIVGHHVSASLRAIANVKAINMALKVNQPPAIHHSDKGSQYIYNIYLELLINNGIAISMCNTALDNAYAERINQTIKNEYLMYWQPKTYKQLKTMVNKAVNNYNNHRIHNNIGRKTPVEFENEVLNLPMQSRPRAIVYADGQLKREVASNHLPFFAEQSLRTHICPIIN